MQRIGVKKKGKKIEGRRKESIVGEEKESDRVEKDKEVKEMLEKEF